MPPKVAKKKPYNPDADVKDATVLQYTVSLDLLQEACDVSWLAITKFKSEGRMAKYIKQFFDKNYGASWQCIVGKFFGSYVSFDAHFFVHVKIGRTVILLYKTYDTSEFERISNCLDNHIVL